MSAVLEDKRTRESMKAGARPGSWKYVPIPLPQQDKEHEARIAAMKRQEQAEHRSKFRANVAAKRQAMPKGKEQDQKYAERQAARGIEPIRPNMPFDRQGAVRSLVRQGIDQSNAGDVFGHNERERAELPNKPMEKRRKPKRQNTNFKRPRIRKSK